MRLIPEAGRLSLVLLFALAPVALSISHPLVSFVFVPLAIVATACSGRARAAAGALRVPAAAAAVLIGLLGLVSAAWAPDSVMAAAKAGVFLLVVFAGAWLAGVLSRFEPAEADRLAVALLSGALAAAMIVGAQIAGRFLFSGYFAGETAQPNIAAIKMNVSSAGLAILLWAALCMLARRLTTKVSKAAAAIAVLAFIAIVMFAGKGIAPKLILLLGALAWASGRAWPNATAVAIGIGIVLLSLALLVVPSRFYQSEGFRDFRALDSSAKYRVDIWDNAAQWIREKPLLGYGAGASQFMPTRAELSKITGEPRNIPLYPHNVLVQVMLELGAAGLLCLWAFVGALLHHITRLSQAARPFALAAFTSAAGVWMIGYPLWRSAWLAWLGFCLLAFIVHERAAGAPGGAPE